MTSFKIRPAEIGDCDDIFHMSEDLNIQEKAPGSSQFVSVEALKRDGFGNEKFFHGIVAEEVPGTSPLSSNSPRHSVNLTSSSSKSSTTEMANQSTRQSMDVSAKQNALLAVDVTANQSAQQSDEIASNQRTRLLGYSLYSFSFATYGPGRVLSLIDLYVREDRRRQGIGKALFKDLARVSLSKNCQEMTWHAFSWNKGAIDFYKILGAVDVTTSLALNSFSIEHKEMSKLVT